MKKSGSDTNQNVIRLKNQKRIVSHPWTINQKNMQTFDGRYFEYKGEKYKKSLIKDDLKKPSEWKMHLLI